MTLEGAEGASHTTHRFLSVLDAQRQGGALLRTKSTLQGDSTGPGQEGGLGRQASGEVTSWLADGVLTWHLLLCAHKPNFLLTRLVSALIPS